MGMLKAGVFIAVALGLFGGGVKVGADHVRAKRDREKAAQMEAAQDLSRETRRAFDAITVNSKKERGNANATIASLGADVRVGTERLSVTVAVRPEVPELGIQKCGPSFCRRLLTGLSASPQTLTTRCATSMNASASTTQ